MVTISPFMHKFSFSEKLMCDENTIEIPKKPHLKDETNAESSSQIGKSPSFSSIQ
jgi:hypothetical protein